MALVGKPDWIATPQGGWLALMRPGDWGMLGLLSLVILFLVQLSWQQPGAARVRIYQNGQLFGEYDLGVARKVVASGPLGDTIVEIAAGRVRIAKDPSPRQYCVKAGWLEAAGQIAICLPNRTSIELVGHQPAPYDSLAF